MKIARLYPVSILVALLLSGCASTTIDFTEPPETKLSIRRKNYVFPIAVRLPQRTPSLVDKTGYNIELDIPDSANPGTALTAYGKLYVYKVALSDVDRLARNFFRIPDEKIASLKSGAAVTIEGLSADRSKRLYKAVIGLKKPEEEYRPSL